MRYLSAGRAVKCLVAFSSMSFAILLAIFLVYIVMASQFESLLHPFVIMFTIPFALVGVAAALFITSKPVSVIVLIGVVMLAGIVVNNAIILVDCINSRIKEGMPRREAIIEGGKIRLRPIMMTTTTTILGLLPLALGLGEGSRTQDADGYYCNRWITFLYTSDPHTGTRSVRHRRKDKRIGLEKGKYLKKSFSEGSIISSNT